MNKVGRPSKLNDAMIQGLSIAIENGLPMYQAAALCNLEHHSITRWLAQAEEDRESGLSETESRFIQLHAAIKKAEARCIQRNLDTIETHAPTNWQAAAWLLERKYPDLFGQRTRQDVTIREPLTVTIKRVD